MSKFNEYMETVNLHKRMTPEDIKEIEKHRREIAHLKSSGDDSVIQDEIRYEYSKIRQIENKYKTDDEKKRAQDSKDRSSKKRFDKQKETRHNKANDVAKKYNSLSDEDKAKEAIISIKNFRFSFSDPKNKREHKNEQEKMINEILSAFNIKERPYTFKSKFSLSEKASGLSARPDDIEDLKEEGIEPIKYPAKLAAIAKKYDRYPLM